MNNVPVGAPGSSQQFRITIPGPTDPNNPQEGGGTTRVLPPAPQVEDTINRVTEVLKKKEMPKGIWFGCACGLKAGECVRDTYYEFKGHPDLHNKTGRSVDASKLNDLKGKKLQNALWDKLEG